jgi:hypothetical protein
MKAFLYGIQILVFAALVVPAAYGNCYVIENKTNSPIKLQFDYNGPVGNGTVTAVELMPNGRYPTRNQWCWNTREDQWAKVTVVTNAEYRPSWSGQLILGNGGPASPSGVYSLNPPAGQGNDQQQQPPPQRRR